MPIKRGRSRGGVWGSKLTDLGGFGFDGMPQLALVLGGKALPAAAQTSNIDNTNYEAFDIIFRAEMTGTIAETCIPFGTNANVNVGFYGPLDVTVDGWEETIGAPIFTETNVAFLDSTGAQTATNPCSRVHGTPVTVVKDQWYRLRLAYNAATFKVNDFGPAPRVNQLCMHRRKTTLNPGGMFFSLDCAIFRYTGDYIQGGFWQSNQSTVVDLKDSGGNTYLWGWAFRCDDDIALEHVLLNIQPGGTPTNAALPMLKHFTQLGTLNLASGWSADGDFPALTIVQDDTSTTLMERECIAPYPYKLKRNMNHIIAMGTRIPPMTDATNRWRFYGGNGQDVGVPFTRALWTDFSKQLGKVKVCPVKSTDGGASWSASTSSEFPWMALLGKFVLQVRQGA